MRAISNMQVPSICIEVSIVGTVETAGFGCTGTIKCRLNDCAGSTYLLVARSSTVQRNYLEWNRNLIVLLEGAEIMEGAYWSLSWSTMTYWSCNECNVDNKRE